MGDRNLARLELLKRNVGKSLIQFVVNARGELTSLTSLNYNTKKKKLKALVELYLDQVTSLGEIGQHPEASIEWASKFSKTIEAEKRRWGVLKSKIISLKPGDIEAFKAEMGGFLTELAAELKMLRANLNREIDREIEARKVRRAA